MLTGEGRIFCAGADVHWMKRVVEYSYEENYEDSLNLARMLREIYTCPKPVVGSINGAAIGGGTGFVAVCDISNRRRGCRLRLYRNEARSHLPRRSHPTCSSAWVSATYVSTSLPANGSRPPAPRRWAW